MANFIPKPYKTEQVTIRLPLDITISAAAHLSINASNMHWIIFMRWKFTKKSENRKPECGSGPFAILIKYASGHSF